MDLQFEGWMPSNRDFDAIYYISIPAISLMVSVFILFNSRFLLLYKCTGKSEIFMPFHVSRLGRSDIIPMFILIIYKYVLQTLGWIPRTRVAPDGIHVILPELQLSTHLAIDASDNLKFDLAVERAKYRGASQDQRLMLLPAITTPMMAFLLANRKCPINALGSVNTKNTFDFIDGEACRNIERTMDQARTIVSARIGGQDLLARRVKKGIEFDIVVEVIGPRLKSDEKKVVFRQTFTILAFLPKSTKPPPLTDIKEENRLHWIWDSQIGGLLKLDANAPHRWAAVCADYNPIHVSAIMARMFGYTNKIAHGNHALACCLEMLSIIDKSENWTTTLESIRGSLTSAPSLKMAVQFLRPMILPIRLDIHLATSGVEHAIRASKGGKPMFEAQIF